MAGRRVDHLRRRSSIGPVVPPVLADPGDLTSVVFHPSDADGPREATDITLGPDGNVWFLATTEMRCQA